MRGSGRGWGRYYDYYGPYGYPYAGGYAPGYGYPYVAPPVAPVLSEEQQAAALAAVGAERGICSIANRNAPGQIVLSGELAALDAVEAGYARGLSVHITEMEGVDHMGELRKMRLLLESLL